MAEKNEIISRHPLVLFRDFRMLFLGRIISAIGDKFFTIALAWWVVSYGGENSKLHLALLMASNVIGVVVFAPWMGNMADKFNKKHCMMAADAARFSMLALLSYFFYQEEFSLSFLYFCCFAIAAFVPLFEAAASSSLGLLTDTKSLPGAVAIDSSILGLSNVLGAAVGGIVLAAIGTLGAFMGNGFTFLLSFCFIWAIRTNLEPSTSSRPESQQGKMGEIIAYLVKKPAIGILALSLCIINFFSAPLLLFIPMVVKFLLQYSVGWVAAMEGSLALGAVVATLILSCVPRLNQGSIYPKFFWGVLTMGAMALVMAWVPNGLAITGALFVFGIAMGLVNTTLQATFQQIVPNEIKGRFFALVGAASFALVPLAYVCNGLVSQYFPLPWAITANGIALMITSAAFLFISQVAEDAHE
ncbi:enterobactin exporter EntS [Sporomusa ovata DSM 2662]|uniref:MFS permease n=1 Tax=Sporomusa ovata TaxID=2378 RepID=A0A0U1L1X6_9FIRM|nr:MFS transporter [Sporomusa ovata]EQB25001.1 major facilitator superfamily MFS_1 [Sporomusa ovata DSM 2662]CQR73545.1 MFS permease [Sporomusa ovata]